MIINHNLMADNAIRNMNINQSNAAKAMAKLSSGLRINNASDDAAGLAISEKMKGQINGLNQASSNAQNGISMVQTAEGALNETTSILQRMRTLAVQSSNDTSTDQDRSNIQLEMGQLESEIDRIGNTTQFNTKNLLDGSMGNAEVATKNINKSEVLKISTAIAISAIADASGNSLKITSGSSIKINFTINGKNYTSTATVSSSKTLDGVLAAATSGSVTISAGIAILTAKNAGTANAIEGLSITVSSTDSNGNVSVNTAASNALSSFSETQQAYDKRADGSATLLIGANGGQNLNININDMRAQSLGVAKLDVSTQANANVAIKVIDNATQRVSAERAKLGAYENRLDHTINNLGTESQNLTSAQSSIADVDMASEMAEFSKQNVLTQAAQSMLSQANQQPQQVLQLLRG